MFSNLLNFFPEIISRLDIKTCAQDILDILPLHTEGEHHLSSELIVDILK